MKVQPKHLDGITAVIAAENTAMRKLKGEMDTAFVKRIVCAYINALPEANELYAALLRAVRATPATKE